MRRNLSYNWPHHKIGMYTKRYCMTFQSHLSPIWFTHTWINLLVLHKKWAIPLIDYNLERPSDNDGLVSEHFIHASDTLLLLLPHIFNRVMSEGSSSRQRSKRPCNYKTIIISHYLPKLYDLIPKSKNDYRSARQTSFHKEFTTLGHMLILQALIEEGGNY